MVRAPSASVSRSGSCAPKVRQWAASSLRPSAEAISAAALKAKRIWAKSKFVRSSNQAFRELSNISGLELSGSRRTPSLT